jgi:hypothetical protein
MKVVRINIQIENRKLRPKKECQMIQIRAFKKKEKERGEERSQLGLWKVPSLMPNRRFQCLVALERRRKNINFTYFHFPGP